MRRTRVKICGLTSVDDASLAVAGGAWALGLVLWEGSSRACTLEAAQEIAAVHRRAAEICGVFVNATLDDVVRTVDVAQLSMVQLHGDEGPSFCVEVARRTGVKVVKAARVGARWDVQDLERYRTDMHLMDTRVDGKQGGTGETFDWALTKERMNKHVPLILSGGLHPGNVGAAIDAVRPFAVDTASGTEAAPGVKDPELITAFFAAVDAADQAIEDAKAAAAVEEAAS
ncbi:phosphoribosylanthranilate isomerase [Paraconexibacter antarcticus]|uniref:N-(5'-phosphoribosyl)anthranilate isomerase n=1 Tax=Paraconexibacter antarcticus TaxID=2949664 RepID=A0ABY5DPA5_9ACTN|nr:phosphoribosylanthranilate isomerase [Paraconexibacter antarcticus]UTI62439.1 phosphoribosylanthranilate isomerase [Paraconexibacter antarcticus]